MGAEGAVPQKPVGSQRVDSEEEVELVEIDEM